MAKRSVKSDLTISTLDTVLRHIIEPVVNALDYDTVVNQQAEGIMNDAAGSAKQTVRTTQQQRVADMDSGHELPSQRDMGLRILLGQLCQTIHNQTFGTINTRTGSVIPNARERFEQSQQQINEMEERGVTSRDLGAIHWFEVNKARLEAYEEMLNAFKLVYLEVIGEKWEPLNMAQNGVRRIDPKDLPPAELERLTRIFGKDKAEKMFARK